MEHVAIDLGARQSQVCIRNSEGAILCEEKVATSALRPFLAKRPHSRVIVETCSESFRIADIALELGHEVRVVPAALARSLGVGARRTKTDRRDAQALSEVSCRVDLQSVHIPSAASRALKTLCGTRIALVQARTKLINTVRGWLRSQGIRVKSGDPDRFPTRVRECPALPSSIARQLRAIESLTSEIHDADAEIEKTAKANPLCLKLMSVPGVGPLTSLSFSATLDEVGRFDGPHKVESYIGLTPGENSSSERHQRTGITKAGSSHLRWLLNQAAWSARGNRPNDPMVKWSIEIEKRRGKRIAIIALARKMAGILFAIARDGSIYSPAKGARTTS